MTIQDAIEFLKNEYYILEFNGSMVITNKFKREFAKDVVMSVGGALPAVIPAKRQQIIAVPVPVPLNSKLIYKKFIKEAEVPPFLPLSSGGRYAANRYSKDAEKEFGKILRDPNIDKRALLISTKLYYKQHNVARQTISNYFIQGTWESVYEDFMDSVDKGNVEDYIKNALKEGNGESTYEEGI